MFGRNEIVGQKHFTDLTAEDRVSITSIFGTLQGEGPYSGRRAVFVRLAKCQLACSFCLPAQTSIRVKREGNVSKIGIGDLEIGDVVFTAKGTTLLQETTVKNVHRRKVPRSEMRILAYKVGLEVCMQFATVDHPFAIASKTGLVYRDLANIKPGMHLYAYQSNQLDKGYEGMSIHKLKREVVHVGPLSDNDWALLTSTQGLTHDSDTIDVVSPECYPHNSFIAGSGHMQMHGSGLRFR